VLRLQVCTTMPGVYKVNLRVSTNINFTVTTAPWMDVIFFT
jgi:hypothetical protein